MGQSHSTASTGSGAEAGDVCLLGEKCACRPLPPRQRQTFHRLLCGDSEKQVALAIGISRHTVHTYVSAIYKQFGVNGRAELLAKIIEAAVRAPVAASGEPRGRKKHCVALTEAERQTLLSVIGTNDQPARCVAHAHTLLLASEGRTDQSISKLTYVSVRTVERIRRQFLREGLCAALERRPQPPRGRKRFSSPA